MAWFSTRLSIVTAAPLETRQQSGDYDQIYAVVKDATNYLINNNNKNGHYRKKATKGNMTRDRSSQIERLVLNTGRAGGGAITFTNTPCHAHYWALHHSIDR